MNFSCCDFYCDQNNKVPPANLKMLKCVKFIKISTKSSQSHCAFNCLPSPEGFSRKSTFIVAMEKKMHENGNKRKPNDHKQWQKTGIRITSSNTNAFKESIS